MDTPPGNLSPIEEIDKIAAMVSEPHHIDLKTVRLNAEKTFLSGTVTFALDDRNIIERNDHVNTGSHVLAAANTADILLGNNGGNRGLKTTHCVVKAHKLTRPNSTLQVESILTEEKDAKVIQCIFRNSRNEIVEIVTRKYEALYQDTDPTLQISRERNEDMKELSDPEFETLIANAPKPQYIKQRQASVNSARNRICCTIEFPRIDRDIEQREVIDPASHQFALWNPAHMFATDRKWNKMRVMQVTSCAYADSPSDTPIYLDAMVKIAQEKTRIVIAEFEGIFSTEERVTQTVHGHFYAKK